MGEGVRDYRGEVGEAEFGHSCSGTDRANAEFQNL